MWATRNVLFACAGALACASVAVAAPTSMTPNLIVFGNSLSDDGNLSNMVGGAGYWHGRFTNSYVWNEYTAKILGVTLVNKAIAGATSNNDITPGDSSNITIPSFHDQVTAWLKDNAQPGQFHLHNDVIEVEIGGNDILGHALDLMTGALNPATFAAQLAGSIANDIEALAAAGYRNIDLWNLPAVEMAPYVVSLGASALVKPVIDMVNVAITKAVTTVAAKHGGGASGIRVRDLNGLIRAALQPQVLSAMDIADTTHACYVKDTSSGAVSVCSNPDQYFFYDSIHPASRMHYLWGTAAAALIRNPTAQLDVSTVMSLIDKYYIGQSNSQSNIIAGSVQPTYTSHIPEPTPTTLPKCH
ncbi:hypothetical protein LPJ61_003518 [Coemansia biformis]|uniref:Uncharacterized protein n=1 Tax=Coemansia biformis TaxID=1286918 RepID=A0A9W8CXL5_9FUNG|nr:hypothetical protein LPJ61_003518 [Coemansia biformis]